MEAGTEWIQTMPIWLLGIVLFVLLMAAAAAARTIAWLQQRHRTDEDAAAKEEAGSQEGYIVSAVLGLLALLTGFTFSLAVDRFETRRVDVLIEANAIGTTYLRTQLLDEPHRTRLSNMLVAYTENRIALATARPADTPPLLAKNDQMITDLWTATVAAFPTIRGVDFSSSFLETMNQVIDMDAARKAARFARVPNGIMVALLVYLVMSAAVLGYVLKGRRGWAAASFLLVLFALSIVLIVDVNRPGQGMIMESQAPMIALRDSLVASPPATFDRLNGVTTPTPP